jgi:hypothetical protein
MRRFLIVLSFITISFLTVDAQAEKAKPVKNAVGIEATAFLKSSPAFAEILLRKTDLLSEVESLLVTYTEEFPRVKEVRFELDVLNTELTALLKVKPEEKEKLTLALGKLIVRKAEIETDYWNLKTKYGDDHPDVKRAKRKTEIYAKAIKDILG